MKAAHFVIYKDDSKEYRWRFVSSNRNVLADSGESYVRKIDCLDAIMLLRSAAAHAPVVLSKTLQRLADKKRKS